MALLSELDLPVLDYTDRPCAARAFTRAWASSAPRAGWRPRPSGAMVLDREAGEFFLRSRSTTFPGLKIAEIFGIDDGPARRGDAPQHPLHRRRRPPAPAQPRQPGVHAARRRALAPGDAHLPRAALGRRARRRALRVRRGVRQALPVARDRDGDGRAARRRAAAAPLVQLDPAAVRRRGADDRARADRARRSSSSTTTPTRCCAARRDDPGDDLVSKLLAAEDEGDRLSDVECVNLVLNVLIGGVDTTQSPARARDPPARRAPRPVGALRARPVAGRAARSRRRCATSRSRRSRRGSGRGLGVPRRDVPGGHGRDGRARFTANRDPAVRRRRRVRHHRRPRPRAPLTFGAGIHYCLGANLARAELQEGLAFLAARMRRLELDGEPVFDGVTASTASSGCRSASAPPERPAPRRSWRPRHDRRRVNLRASCASSW